MLMDIFRDAVGIARFFSVKGSFARQFLEAVEDRITPPLPEPLVFSPIRIRQDEPPRQRGESYDSYFNRRTGHYRDDRGRLRSSDSRLSLLDEKNLKQYHREMFRFYDFGRRAYDMQMIRAKYSF